VVASDRAPLSLVGEAGPAVLAVKGSLRRARPAKAAGAPARP
jgi:hypothetical protein